MLSQTLNVKTKSTYFSIEGSTIAKR